MITSTNSIMRAGGNAQFKAYAHALACNADLLRHDWVLIIDMDEFLVLDPARFTSLPAFCHWHASRGADTVAINWQFLAPEEEHDPLTVPLTRRNFRVLRMEHCGDGVRLVKSLSRPNRVVYSEAHVPFADERSQLRTIHADGAPHTWHNPPAGFSPSSKFADRVNTGPAVINHYIYKSAAEWLWKYTRNPGDHALVQGGETLQIGQPKALEFMRHIQADGLARDERAVTTMLALNEEMARLTALPGIAAARETVQHSFVTRLAKIRTGYGPMQSWDAPARAFLRLAGCT